MSQNELYFLAAVFVVGLLLVLWGFKYLFDYQQRRLDARLKQQLAIIRSAQTVADLRPVLEDIVRQQRDSQS